MPSDPSLHPKFSQPVGGPLVGWKAKDKTSCRAIHGAMDRVEGLETVLGDHSILGYMWLCGQRRRSLCDIAPVPACSYEK